MQNPFDPSEGTAVPKSEAMAWIEKYDSEMRPDKDVDTKSIFFGKNVLLKMLEGRSAGISFFLGLRYNDDAKKELVNLILVPTTSEGALLWEGSEASATGNDSNGAFDTGLPCPPYCPK